MSDESLPNSEIIHYQTEDGRTRIQCRFEGEALWLTQALIAELFEKDVRTVNEHLVNIFDEGELRREATIRKFRIVRSEGRREVAREIEHYNLTTRGKLPPSLRRRRPNWSMPGTERCWMHSHSVWTQTLNRP